MFRSPNIRSSSPENEFELHEISSRNQQEMVRKIVDKKLSMRLFSDKDAKNRFS